jgi:hypothetical protein
VDRMTVLEVRKGHGHQNSRLRSSRCVRGRRVRRCGARRRGSGSKPGLPTVRAHAGVVDPRLKLCRIEPQVTAPLDVRNASFSHQPTNVPDADPEHVGDALNVKQERKAARTGLPARLCSWTPSGAHVRSMCPRSLQNATTGHTTPWWPMTTTWPTWCTPDWTAVGVVDESTGCAGRRHAATANAIGTTPAQPQSSA